MVPVENESNVAGPDNEITLDTTDYLLKEHPEIPE
jgi:hypothetical protein